MNHFLLTLCVIAASVPMLGETARVIPFREFLDATPSHESHPRGPKLERFGTLR